MKNGKTLTLYTTLRGFLMGLWRNLFKEQKDLEVLKMPFVLLKKDERSDWVYLDGTRISKKRVYLLKVYLLSLKLGKYFLRLKSKVKEPQEILAEIYGEPLWCIGTGMRNTHLRAIAPTVSNSKLSGNVSPGIEPWAANVFTEQSAKGTFIRKNPTLVKLLRKLKINNNETWDKILADGGSVQNISELDGITMAHDIPAKEVFKTFKEINQLELVNQAGLRQQYVDQSVSLNLAFPSEATPKWLNKVHFDAWKQGVKTLYYTRTESVLRGDIAQQAMSEDCLACDG